MDSDWAGAPKHLLDLILENLESSIHYLRFGIVCLRWHSVMEDNKAKRIKTLHRQYRYHQVPMLLTPSEDEHTWNIYNVMDNKFLELELIVPYSKRFCGSSKGWLIAVNKDWSVTLYKPYSMVKNGNNADTCIQLPCLFPDIPEPEDFEVIHNEPEDFYEEEPETVIDPENVYDYYVYKALLTADPLANPHECMVIVIFGSCNELAFIRLAQNTTWTKIESAENFSSDEVLLYNNLFYVVDGYGALRSFDVTDSCLNSTIKYVAPKLPVSRVKFDYFIKRYLVESCGQILQVERYLSWRNIKTGPRVTKKFRVWRFDLEMENWIEIKSLDGMALFLGDNSSVSLLASNFSKIQPNCIYFTHDVDEVFASTNPMIYDMGIYNFESRKFKLHFTLDSATLRKMNNRPPIWVIPTL